MDWLVGPLVVGFITLGIYKIFELYARRRERILLIEKLAEIKEPLEAKGKISLDFSSGGFQFSSLRMGCLLLGLGVAFLIAYFICSNTIEGYNINLSHDAKLFITSRAEIIYAAALMLGGGLGLLTSFLIELKMQRDDKKE